MKNILLLILTSFFSWSVIAQTTADFEEFSFDASSYDNIMPNGFISGNILLPNDTIQFPGFIAWDGWALSSVVDPETPGFLNEFAVISGSGYGGSNNYAVSYKYEAANLLYLTGEAIGKPVAGFYINNGTYPYFSMLDGDFAAKRFGGETGDDEDFFLLTIAGYLNGALKTEKVEFYLADYRFADNSQDYIIDEWTYIDLLPLGNVDSLSFTLTSSDNGEFGMNTPAYFCLDNLTTTDMVVSTDELVPNLELSISPNPAHDFINLYWPVEANGTYQIYNLHGQMMGSGALRSGSNQLTITNFPAGTYLLHYAIDTGWNSCRFVKY
jgi:hypothetical protein